MCRGKIFMVQMVIFINLFFIPTLSVFLLYRNKNEMPSFGLGLLFTYCAAVSCNVPLAKVFIFFIRKATGISISIDSGYYTLAAILAALFIPEIWRIYQRFKSFPDKRIYIKNMPKQFKQRIMYRGIRGVLKDIAPASLLVFVSSFMLFVFEPILMY